MERKLASIQKITKLSPIPNADAIECADVLGWHVVVKKGEFRVGDLCVYCEVDSLLPDKPEYEFLRNKNFIIRTIRMRGQISQGICFPTKAIPELATATDLIEGLDVTQWLGITEYEKALPDKLLGEAIGYMPSYIHKTEEMRIQSYPNVLIRNKNCICYISEKVDGESITVWKKDGVLNVAGKKVNYKPSETNIYWKVSNKLELDKIIPNNLIFQGELIGPGTHRNRCKLIDNTIKWFSICDLTNSQYLNYRAFSLIVKDLGLQTVPIINDHFELNHTVDQLVELSKGKSQLADIYREGIVIRALMETTDPDIGRLSFKVLNPDYLLKYEE